jgi:hypothetical protein
MNNQEHKIMKALLTGVAFVSLFSTASFGDDIVRDTNRYEFCGLTKCPPAALAQDRKVKAKSGSLPNAADKNALGLRHLKNREGPPECNPPWCW